jgi:TusA-related sulfurtransferase
MSFRSIDPKIGENKMNRKNLDCKGISCPKPLILISKEVRQMSPGDELVVNATDPNFLIDIKAWSDRTGHPIVSVDEEDDKMTAVIKIV